MTDKELKSRISAAIKALTVAKDAIGTDEDPSKLLELSENEARIVRQELFMRQEGEEL